MSVKLLSFYLMECCKCKKIDTMKLLSSINESNYFLLPLKRSMIFSKSDKMSLLCKRKLARRKSLLIFYTNFLFFLLCKKFVKRKERTRLCLFFNFTPADKMPNMKLCKFANFFFAYFLANVYMKGSSRLFVSINNWRIRIIIFSLSVILKIMIRL